MIQLLLLEFALVIVSIVAALAFPRLGSGIFGALERRFAALARRKNLAVLSVTLLGLFAAGLPRLFQGIPRPQKHDEFSYLLAADTFAHGRLTNPTHPMWQHFESFHILQQPSYMAMYPPAQGIVLAAGKLLFGHPWFGILISMSLMCGAICWALQAWLPPEWALLGGLIAVMRIAMFSYWIESYYGGAVAAIGGTLMLGALPRLLRYGRVRHALLLAAGVVIVANSRPFEGMVLTLAVAGVLAFWGFKQPRVAIRVLAPALLLLCLAGGAMLYYNWRITNNPLLMPFAANRAQYAVAKYFVWQRPNSIPEYRHKVMRDFYLGWEMTAFNLSRGFQGWEVSLYEKIFRVWMFYFGPIFTVALFPILRVVRDRRIRPLIVIGGVSAAILSLSIFVAPHYLAPYIVLIYAVLLQGLRHVRAWRLRGRPSGIALTRAIPVVCLVLIAVRAAAVPLKLSMFSDTAFWCSQLAPDYQREDVIATLKKMGGRHLVIVRYAPDHSPHWEWVYNDADIDNAPVVWAREMDAAHNAELLRYFHDRRVWLIEPDKNWTKLTDYEAH